MKMSGHPSARVIFVLALTFFNGCASSKSSRLPLEPETRWALLTPPKLQAPLVPPSTRCLSQGLSIFARPTSIRLCAWAVDRGRWPETALHKEPGRANAESFYAEGSRKIPASGTAAPEMSRGPFLVAATGALPAPAPAAPSALESLSGLQSQPLSLASLPFEQGRPIKVVVNARY